MTVRLSTGLAASMINGGGVAAYAPQTSGTLVVGRPYRIHSFVAGDSFTNVGAASNATGVDFVATGTTPTTWTNASVLTPMTMTGGMREAFRHGFINIYSGPQPLTADTGATGTLLGTVSVDAGGVGVIFDLSTTNVLSKPVAVNWKCTGLAIGTAGWFRFYPGGGDPTLLSTTEARLDGAVATSGSDMNISNISFAVGSPCTVDTFSYEQPTA